MASLANRAPARGQITLARRLALLRGAARQHGRRADGVRPPGRSDGRQTAPRGSPTSAQGRHIAPRPCDEGERPLAAAAFSFKVQDDQRQRGAARGRCKLACCASSPESESGGVHRAKRFWLGVMSPHLPRRTTAARRRREASRRHVALLRSAWVDHNHRDTARAAAISQFATPPPLRQRAQTRLCRVTHGAGLALGCRRWHVAPRMRTERKSHLAITA